MQACNFWELFLNAAKLYPDNTVLYDQHCELTYQQLYDNVQYYIAYLQKFKAAIDDQDSDTTIQLMAEANDIKRILN